VDSRTSLYEFENLEQACKDADTVEKIAKEQEDVLSEIEDFPIAGLEAAAQSGPAFCEAFQLHSGVGDGVHSPRRRRKNGHDFHSSASFIRRK
jgi:hypothetical protein